MQQSNRQSPFFYTVAMCLASAGLCVLLTGFAVAQQQEQATEQAKEDASNAAEAPAIAPAIVYMEAPVLYVAGEEPVLALRRTAAVDPEADPEFPSRAASILDYTATVAQIESAGGAWDADLVENLAVLSDLQQSQGDHPAAIDSLNRALHISRINNGLNTTAQIDLVQELIESYRALADWESADLYHNYLFYIQQKAYGSSDPRLIPVLTTLGDWHLEAFHRGVGDPLGLRLSSAIILYNAAVRLLAEFDNRNISRYEEFLYSIANIAFLIARNGDLMSEIDRSQFRSQQDQLRDMLNEDSAVIPGGFQTGERALLDIIAVQMNFGDGIALADAYTQLGDWYLLSDRRRNAAEQYAYAWQLLVPPAEEAAAEEAEQDQQPSDQQPGEFSRVTLIPAFVQHDRWLTRPGLERPAIESLQWGEVDLSFTVTRNGQVRDIEILSEETEENTGHFARVSRELRRYRFRPPIVDGEMVESLNNQVRVRFWY